MKELVARKRLLGPINDLLYRAAATTLPILSYGGGGCTSDSTLTSLSKSACPARAVNLPQFLKGNKYFASNYHYQNIKFGKSTPFPCRIIPVLPKKTTDSYISRQLLSISPFVPLAIPSRFHSAILLSTTPHLIHLRWRQLHSINELVSRWLDN